MNKSLFAYGTLLLADIFTQVTGKRASPTLARLPGYRRRMVIGECYPAIIPDRNEEVTGAVYGQLEDLHWQRLDRFEGEMYERRQVNVELENNSFVKADAYVLLPDFYKRLSKEEWHLDAFIRDAKDDFVSNYLGFASIPEVIGTDGG